MIVTAARLHHKIEKEKEKEEKESPWSRWGRRSTFKAGAIPYATMHC
jgi:hypothetical protein